MRKINKTGLQLIKKYEGFVPYVYLCPAGYPTIGYGHLCREGDYYLKNISLNKISKLPRLQRKKIKISQKQAEALLKQDLEEAESGVNRLINVPLSGNQFSALVSFTFNLGSGALQRSTLRRKLNRREYGLASLEFRKWVYARGRRLRGLVNRRMSEFVLFWLPI